MTSPPSAPQPPSIPIVGHALKVARDPYTVHRWVNEHCGPVGEVRVFGSPVVWLTGPDVIEEALVDKRDVVTKSEDFRITFGEGLLSTTGDQWLRQRNSLMEYFTSSRIRSFGDEMVSLCETRCDWDDGQEVQLLDEMQNLTLEILFATLFGMDVEANEVDSELHHAVRNLDNWFRPTSWILPNWVPTPGRYKFKQASKRLDAKAEQLLTAAQQGDETTMLSMLATQAADGDQGLSMREIRDQMRTFMFAGHDTTALAMTFSLYFLGTHDDVRRQLYEEVDDVLGDSPPTVEDIDSLVTVENVVRETLRLHPPVFNIPRVAAEPVTIGGYHIEESTRIFVSPIAVQRDEQFWNDPLEWRPSRWNDLSPHEKGYTYLPFGAGPRICIGRRFGLLETQLVIATLCQRYQLRPRTELEVDPKMTGQPADGVPVTVRIR